MDIIFDTYDLQDYVATRWYRAPELCGSFFSKVSPIVISYKCSLYWQKNSVWVVKSYVWSSHYNRPIIIVPLYKLAITIFYHIILFPPWHWVLSWHVITFHQCFVKLCIYFRWRYKCSFFLFCISFLLCVLFSCMINLICIYLFILYCAQIGTNNLLSTALQ